MYDVRMPRGLKNRNPNALLKICTHVTRVVDPNPYWESGSGFRGGKMKRRKGFSNRLHISFLCKRLGHVMFWDIT
jgi:hypothetical protein